MAFFPALQAVDDPERASRGGWVFDGRDPVFGCRDLRWAAWAVERSACKVAAHSLCAQTHRRREGSCLPRGPATNGKA